MEETSLLTHTDSTLPQKQNPCLTEQMPQSTQRQNNDVELKLAAQSIPSNSAQSVTNDHTHIARHENDVAGGPHPLAHEEHPQSGDVTLSIPSSQHAAEVSRSPKLIRDTIHSVSESVSTFIDSSRHTSPLAKFGIETVEKLVASTLVQPAATFARDTVENYAPSLIDQADVGLNRLLQRLDISPDSDENSMTDTSTSNNNVNAAIVDPSTASSSSSMPLSTSSPSHTQSSPSQPTSEQSQLQSTQESQTTQQPSTAVDVYWDRLRVMFAQSSWYRHVDDILMGNKVLDLVSKRLVRPAEFFFGAAAECFLEHNTVDEYLDALKERLGATWDDRLTQPARVFFATASSAQKICGAGRFFGGMIQLGRQKFTYVVNDISDRFDKLVLVTEEKLYRMFTHGTDEKKGAGQEQDDTEINDASASSGDVNSNASNRRSPVNITFNEFVKLARLAKVQQPQPDDRRGQGHSIDDLILKRSRSFPDLSDDSEHVVASTDATEADHDEEVMADHDEGDLDTTMAQSPLCSSSTRSSFDDSEPELDLSERASECESDDSECDEEDSVYVGEYKAKELSSSSSSSSSSMGALDRLRHRQFQQQRQRLGGKSMDVVNSKSSPSSTRSSEPLKRRRASVDSISSQPSRYQNHSNSYSPSHNTSNGQVNALAHTLAHTSLSQSHSPVFHVSPHGTPAQNAEFPRKSSYPAHAHLHSSPSAPTTSVEDGGDHTGRRTRQKKEQMGGYLAELGPVFKRDLTESQWFEKTNAVLLDNALLKQLGQTMGNIQAAQFLSETAAEVFLSLPVQATSTRLALQEQNASGDAFALHVRERLGAAWDARLASLLAFFFQRAVQRSSEVCDTVCGDVSSTAVTFAAA